MIALPALQTAIVGTADGNLAISHEAAVPAITGDTLLVRTKAVSINPVDTKMVGPYITAGAIAGCDFAGEVVSVGPDASSKGIQVGDRVYGAVMGMNPREPSIGAFATYVGVSATNVLRMSPTMSYAQAAAIGTSFMTSGLALFYSLGLPGDSAQPSQRTRPIPVLVSGGSTASGTAAIQLLRLAGFAPLATSSPGHFELVKSYGATAVFDYTSPSCASDIRTYTKNNLRYALDCVTTVESMKLCYSAIGRAGGYYTGLDPFPKTVAATRKMVRPDWVLGPTMIGKEIAWPEPHYRAVDPKIRKFGQRWRQIVEDLFLRGELKVHPIDVQHHGFQGTLDGMDKIREGLVRGKKLVCPIPV
ncbi:zinc-binding alcohol dehydrogenase family protein [Aspergillus thermomutatus]|uniref:Enoyl reductase (ER) domain-containing protein n=1 Tax=Aspergillus thermomutatus TaxID=41047 RepID=A0A397GUQ5_ASPTH|nr:uncharacterized protein CDV56_107676 [Aspergillus thermomutatus]RHZ54029.1 hypothetical protein CDV56_107676 [Aspergillus thermomutatus]